MFFACEDDVCIFCAAEYAKEHNVKLSVADKALKWQLTNKKAYRIPIPATRCTICFNHIVNMAKEVELINNAKK